MDSTATKPRPADLRNQELCVQVCGFQSLGGYVFPPGKTPECWEGLGIFKLSGETWIDCGYSSLDAEGNVVSGNFGTTISVTTL